jgi:hypothetical protein
VSDAGFVGVETGGTKILARIVDTGGLVLADGRWPTTTKAKWLPSETVAVLIVGNHRYAL